MTSRTLLLNRVRHVPLLALVGVQLPACVPVLILLYLHPLLDVGIALLVQSTVAVLLSRWVLQQGRWWMPVHLLFVPAIVVALHAGIGPGWYLLGLVLCLLLFGGAWRGHVPLFISSKAALQGLDQILPSEPQLRFVDLGCGSGAVLSAVSSIRPGWQISGVEAAWLPWLWARLRVALFLPGSQVRRANFWRMPLHADVVYAYLSPTPMLALLRKLEQDGGSRYLISYRFGIPGVEPDQVVELADGSQLYRWDLRRKP